MLNQQDTEENTVFFPLVVPCIVVLILFASWLHWRIKLGASFMKHSMCNVAFSELSHVGKEPKINVHTLVVIIRLSSEKHIFKY